MCFFFFFFFPHPQEELAKFGYKEAKKVEKSKNPAIFWWPPGN